MNVWGSLMSEFRERESYKVICILLVEDRQGGLVKFVIWF